MPFRPGAYPGVVHHYAPRLIAFEHMPSLAQNQSSTNAHNFVLFLGGLGDSLMTVRYPYVLATLLPRTWALVELQLSSTGLGWTTGMLERDSSELETAVSYFRDLSRQRDSNAQAKVILLGHSTGCQIAMNYLVGSWKQPLMPNHVKERPAVDGVIFQAGISDREAITLSLSSSEVEESLRLAEEMCSNGRAHDHVPEAATKHLFAANPSAERWISLASREGEDDYFSSDLPEARLERVWGERGIASRGLKVMVLLGEKDEGMPAWLNKTKLLSSWETQVKGANGVWDDRSGVVPGATHNLNKSDETVVKDLCGRVLGLVHSVDPELAHKDVGRL